MKKRQAVLLIGPTGSGKTPLGDWLQERGLGGRRCVHFDFGACLREVASTSARDGFTPDEVCYIRNVVEQGALLENETFYLAMRILEGFVRDRQLDAEDLLIMNGLPRHAGQAVRLAPIVDILAVVQLHCNAESVLERLRRNSGGDRTHRTDDSLALVRRKLATFAERTQPLLSLYQDLDIPLIPVAVKADTQPADVYEHLQREWALLTFSTL